MVVARPVLAFLVVPLLALASCSSDSGSDSEATDDSVDAVADGDTDDDATAAEYDFSAVDQTIEDFVAENELNGAGLIVVHEDDGVVHEEHWGEFDEDRVSLIASSSKMITAGVLLNLADQGLIDMDAPVADVVDWGSGNPDITPAQLVSNSSGLVGLIPDITYAPYLCQFNYADELGACAESIFTSPDDDADVAAPDTEFRYGGAQWQVAGAVAEAAAGTTWAELIDEIYVEPCGLDSLAYNNPFVQFDGVSLTHPPQFDGDPSVLEATENPNMEGGAYITTGDYGKLLLMHLRDGMCGENQVLSSEALATAHSDRVLEAYGGQAAVGGGDDETGYGMGWWIDRASGRLTDAGAFGAVPWLDLEDGYGAYLVIEADSATGALLAGELYDLVDEAVNAAA